MNVLGIIGLIPEVIAAIILIIDVTPKLNTLIEKLYPFKQINKGLNILIHKTLDERPEDVILRKNDEGFKEILSIINKKYGPYDDDIQLIVFEWIEKQKTVSTSRARVTLLGKNNIKYYPTMAKDLLNDINVWKIGFFNKLSSMLIILGLVIQIFSFVN